jgi:excisionase family DNA binding protein
VKEVADRLNISKYTLYGWLSKGNDIREYAFKINGSWRFDEEDLNKYIKNKKRASRNHKTASQI